MSTVKVNTVDKRTGSTLTLGGCGTTVTLGAGATQSGFGRTGTVDWCTTAKTAPFTGVSGKGYFVNTSCGAVTVTLPATPTAGDIISIKDYAGTFQANNLTLCRNGSKIAGGCAFNPALDSKNQSVTLIYVDATQGWLPVSDDSSLVSSSDVYITATGGTITTCGDYKTHVFTADGCFSVTAGAGPVAQIDYLVVGGGSAGSYGSGGSSGGAGAGGVRVGAVVPSGCHSPIVTTGFPVSIQTYPITVGGGGAKSPGGTGGQGTNSILSTLIAAAGGIGSYNGSSEPVMSGGSGGGGGGFGNPGGLGNTPAVSPPQGNNGGTSTYDGSNYFRAGGGGGATSAGTCGISQPGGGSGGNGIDVTPIFGAAPQPFYQANQPNRGPSADGKFAGGGGGGSGHYTGGQIPVGAGGPGGGGNGSNGCGSNAFDGTANTGGGGGGAGYPVPGCGGSGGSGIVVIKYKFQ
jgi:hypothetical protein